jgi:hypothetical protein
MMIISDNNSLEKVKKKKYYVNNKEAKTQDIMINHISSRRATLKRAEIVFKDVSTLPKRRLHSIIYSSKTF